MQILGKREPILLLLGDLVFLAASLWLSLFLRNLSVPDREILYAHIVPFTILFAVWVVVFYIAGLYGKRTLILKTKLPSIILNTQLANSLIAVLFFYLIPFFGITPKTVLFIYLAVSTLAILVWRMYLHEPLSRRDPYGALLIGSGSEAKELLEEVNNNNIYSIRFVEDLDDASVAVVDFSDKRLKTILPDLYKQIFSGLSFVEMHKVYEDVFDRVPLSLLGYEWFLKNISIRPHTTYDAMKRIMDIALSLALGTLSLVLYPFVALAIKLEDGGPVFISQERVGQNNKPIRIHKFRSMTANDEGRYGEGGVSALKVTKVGEFLRKSRIDELPQLWSVLLGGQSLIGPRPELPALTSFYEKEIPYYNVRHIIKPGLSGWAQIYHENHPHHGAEITKTREKLSYDLYYIKNRSFILDIQIALRTVKTLLSRVGI